MGPKLPYLYLITDRKQAIGRPLADVVKSALDGGIRLVQLREKDFSGRELFDLARELRELTKRYNAKLLINDRVDIAIAVGADGVHLGRQSMSVYDARHAFETSSLIPHPSSFLIGVSTHSIKEALEAQSDGAGFITFGPVYFTPSKAVYGKPVGIEKLREVAKSVNIPVYALGGIKEDNIGEVMNSGTYGIAVVSAIMAAKNVRRKTEDILKIITRHQPLSPIHEPPATISYPRATSHEPQTMTTTVHAISSAALAAGIYRATTSLEMASAALFVGIFLDIDHIIDFLIFSGERFSISRFRAWCYEGRWNKLILMFHSYELFVLYSFLVYKYPNPILLGILCGMGLHLTLDQLGNRHLIKAFTISKWFYFFTFRAWGGFHKDWLRTSNVQKPSGST